MGTGTVLRLPGRRAGGKSVSADSKRLFLPWFGEGRTAARQEAAHWTIKQRGEFNRELEITPEWGIMPCIKNKTWHARIKAFQVTTFWAGPSISKVKNINTLYYRCLYARHQKKTQTNQPNKPKTPSYRKRQSYVHLCISLKTMILSSAAVQLAARHNLQMMETEEISACPLPLCRRWGSSREPQGMLGRGNKYRCVVPVGPFLLWAPTLEVSKLCGKIEMRGANGLNAMSEC